MSDLQVLRAVFTPTIANDIYGSHAYTGEGSFADTAMACIHMRTNLPLDTEFPTSVPHFIQVCSSILTQNVRNTITQNAQEFDKICGVQVAEEFLKQRTFGAWLHLLADRLEHATDSSATIGSELSSFASTEQSSKARTLSSTTTAAPSLDKALFDGSAEDDSRIIQVELRGANLLQAFEKDQTIVEYGWQTTLASLETNGPPKGWTPSQHSSFPVFHGTSVHYKHPDWPDAWQNEKLNIRAEDKPSQMAPLGVPVVYTAFSPLRSFLWAAFPNHIYISVPGAKNIGWMNRAWYSNGHEFRGLAIFQFKAIQPADSKLNAVCIPPGNGNQWANTVQGLASAGKVTTQTAWNSTKTLHGSNVAHTWPHVLHGLEFGQQHQFLQQFRGNMWRSAWLDGEAVDLLNKNYINTIAISFELTAPPPSLTLTPTSSKTQPKKKPDDDGKKKTGKGLFKKAPKVFKSFGCST